MLIGQLSSMPILLPFFSLYSQGEDSSLTSAAGQMQTFLGVKSLEKVHQNALLRAMGRL